MGKIKDAFEGIKAKTMDIWDSSKDNSMILKANFEDGVNKVKEKEW